jgi:hypothetical protein
MEVTVTILFFGFFLVFTWLVLTANSRRRIVALVVAGTLVAVLISAPPAQAQASLLAEIQAVLNTINGVIQTALNSINSVRTAISNLYQNLTWPVQLINQAKAQVTQMIGQYRSLMRNILNIDLRSATLANPAALETVIRDHQTTNFGNLVTAYGFTYGAIPTATNASPADRAMIDMDDAVALDNLKTLKASDQAADLTLQVADLLENGASQAAPGSAPFLTASAVVASIESQAVTQKMLAAELRQDATRAAHENALRKRGAVSSSQLRGIITNLLRRR